MPPTLNNLPYSNLAAIQDQHTTGAPFANRASCDFEMDSNSLLEMTGDNFSKLRHYSSSFKTPVIQSTYPNLLDMGN